MESDLVNEREEKLKIAEQALLATCPCPVMAIWCWFVQVLNHVIVAGCYRKGDVY